MSGNIRALLSETGWLLLLHLFCDFVGMPKLILTLPPPGSNFHWLFLILSLCQCLPPDVGQIDCKPNNTEKKIEITTPCLSVGIFN